MLDNKKVNGTFSVNSIINIYFPLGVFVAPTAHLADKRKSHELEMCKLRVEWQKEKIDELTKERDYLKEQLVSGKTHNTRVQNYSTVESYYVSSALCSCVPCDEPYVCIHLNSS